MIRFVNAKVNLGLNVVARREDGYHDLETVFYPVGIESGMPQQPEGFDDILEIIRDPSKEAACTFKFMGRRIDCEPQKNLVVRAATLFLRAMVERAGMHQGVGALTIILDKHLPDGAGLGGGSADASFTLTTLNDIYGKPFSPAELEHMALKLGADCPFFIRNVPCFAEGVGEQLRVMPLDLKGNHMLIVKPEVFVSTKVAFAGIKPRKPDFDLRRLPALPLAEWRGKVVNDFEETVFAVHPELWRLKEGIYNSGAVYASMSGSGSAIYGIYSDAEKAREAAGILRQTYRGVWLFSL